MVELVIFFHFSGGRGNRPHRPSRGSATDTDISISAIYRPHFRYIDPSLVVINSLLVYCSMFCWFVVVARQKRPGCQASSAVDSSTVAVNHLFVGRDMMNNCSTGSGRCARWPRPFDEHDPRPYLPPPPAGYRTSSRNVLLERFATEFWHICIYCAHSGPEVHHLRCSLPPVGTTQSTQTMHLRQGTTPFRTYLATPAR